MIVIHSLEDFKTLIKKISHENVADILCRVDTEALRKVLSESPSACVGECVQCRKKLYVGDRIIENDPHFLFCSEECANSFENQVIARCAHCKKFLTRKDRIIENDNYFCSEVCQNAFEEAEIAPEQRLKRLEERMGHATHYVDKHDHDIRVLYEYIARIEAQLSARIDELEEYIQNPLMKREK